MAPFSMSVQVPLKPPSVVPSKHWSLLPCVAGFAATYEGSRSAVAAVGRVSEHAETANAATATARVRLGAFIDCSPCCHYELPPASVLMRRGELPSQD